MDMAIDATRKYSLGFNQKPFRHGPQDVAQVKIRTHTPIKRTRSATMVKHPNVTILICVVRPTIVTHSFLERQDLGMRKDSFSECRRDDG